MSPKQKTPAHDRGASEVHIQAASWNTSDSITTAYRVQREAERIHALGPRPLGELLLEVIATCPDLAIRVAAYASINPAAIALLDAARFVTPFAAIDGGRGPL
jgi:hypothetical protein